MAASELLSDYDILFLDFLGFAEAVENWSDERMAEVVTLLRDIAAAQSSFDLKGEKQPDGSYKITSRAELTAFSDHIVASYPRKTRPDDIAEEIWPALQYVWDDMVRHQMQKLTAQVVRKGLEIGLLVRGGMSRGKLYHEGRVVIGKAMIDAYRLESHFAYFPRVAVSPSVPGDDRISKDIDGRRYLDYFTELMHLADDIDGDAKRWAREKLVMIDSVIEALKQQWPKAEKWMYFRDKLHHQMETWPD